MGGGAVTRGPGEAPGERGPARSGGVSARAGSGLASSPGGKHPSGGGDPDGVIELPATTRLGPGGGSGRGLRTMVALIAIGLVLAVVKPWNWLSGPLTPAGLDITASPAAAPTPAPSPTPSDWTQISARITCLSGGSWMAVVDQVDGPTISRSWTELDPAPATGPIDPAIARTSVYAESVPRIGFCAPTVALPPGASTSPAVPGAGASPGPFRVQAWSLVPAAPAAPPWSATMIDLVPLSGGPLERGALYGPPGSTIPGAAAPSALDPEGAWAVRGPARLPATWAPDGGVLPAGESWQPGTYVFHVELPGAGSGGSYAAWFAIELRGPWRGPSAAPMPHATIAVPGPTPASSAAP